MNNVNHSIRNEKFENLDCLLLNPPDDFSRYPYLGLCLQAAVLREKGISVEILDSSAVGLSMEGILKYIERRKPRIVGISVMSMMLHFSYVLVKKIRHLLPECVIVVGGSHIDAAPEILKEMPADYGFRGECENEFADFCRIILERKTPPLLPGLIKLDGGDLLFGPIPEERPLDDLPMPAYDLLPLERYFSPSTSLRTISFISSRGCPYNCSFCSKFSRTRYRHLSADNTINQLEILVHKLKFQWIEFVDEIFTVNRKRVLELCEGINKLNLRFSWGVATRADLIDEDLIVALKIAGCKKVSFGIETGVEQVRFAAHKYITNIQITDAIRLCQKHGLKTMGDFIFGHPSESLEDMRETIRFSRNCGLNYAYFSRMIPIPNSEVFEMAKTSGKIQTELWSAFMKGYIPFPLYTPDGIDTKAVEHLYRKAWYNFYFWPATIWRNRYVFFSPEMFYKNGRALIRSLSEKRYKK